MIPLAKIKKFTITKYKQIYRRFIILIQIHHETVQFEIYSFFGSIISKKLSPIQSEKNTFFTLKNSPSGFQIEHYIQFIFGHQGKYIDHTILLNAISAKKSSPRCYCQ